MAFAADGNCRHAPPTQPMRRHNVYGRYHIFCVDEIEREDGQIVIEFNMPVNPATVTASAIRVNGMPLPHAVRIRYNRRGDKIILSEIPAWRRKRITLEISGVRSYNDILMEEIPVVYLWDDDEWERDD